MSSVDKLPALAPPPRVTFVEVTTVSARIKDPGLAARRSPGPAAFESIRVLRTKVKAFGEQRFVHCLGLVSATAREGTSALVVGLAAAIAQEPERRVLLVEAGLRAPALERLLFLAGELALALLRSPPTSRPPPLLPLWPWGVFLFSRAARTA